MRDTYEEQDAEYREKRRELVRDIATVLSGGEMEPPTEDELRQAEHYGAATEAETRAWVLFGRVRESLSRKPHYGPKWPRAGINVRRVKCLGGDEEDLSFVYEARDREAGDFLLFDFDYDEGGPCAGSQWFYLSIGRGQVDALREEIRAALDGEADDHPYAHTERTRDGDHSVFYVKMREEAKEADG